MTSNHPKKKYYFLSGKLPNSYKCHLDFGTIINDLSVLSGFKRFDKSFFFLNYKRHYFLNPSLVISLLHLTIIEILLDFIFSFIPNDTLTNCCRDFSYAKAEYIVSIKSNFDLKDIIHLFQNRLLRPDSVIHISLEGC